MKIAQLTALCLTCLFVFLPVAVSAQPFQISADGSEVTDQKTGLIWRRCAEGMNWDGSTCANSPGVFIHEAAFQQASNQAAATGKPWRLPNIKELFSIVDKTRVNPAIDPIAFPATPADGFWSSSPYVDMPSSAWGVSFLDGLVSGGIYSRGSRGDSLHVRLVRIGQ